MDADGELPMPPPRELAEMLLSRAWDDGVADGERLLLEQAAVAIQGLLVELAVVSERAEAGQANYRRHGAVGGCDAVEEQ